MSSLPVATGHRAAENLPEGLLMAAIQRGTNAKFGQAASHTIDWLDTLRDEELAPVIERS